MMLETTGSGQGFGNLTPGSIQQRGMLFALVAMRTKVEVFDLNIARSI